MKRIITASAIALSLTLAASVRAQEDHSSHSKHAVEDAAPAESAVKHEMRLLDAAYKNLIDAILLDTPEAIEPPFHKVHRAKMATEKALHDGKVKLPKNGDKLDEFVEMDEAFHGKLKKLLGAARKKDRKGIQKSAHEILDGCVQCHSRFRN
ncbi:MAG: hypothetical protein OEV42_21300 [Deltaproteobacteria bacterium]|nr:hypothetical protein [Deltaproteobacteria bacterium]